MKKKENFNERKFIFDDPILIQKLRSSRTNYDYPMAKVSDFLGNWVILETFVPDVTSKRGKQAYLLIISTLEDPNDPESPRTWEKFKVFCWSPRINDFLLSLRESDLESSCLPLVLRFIGVPYKDKKTKETKYSYEIDCGLDEVDGEDFPEPPALRS